MPPLYPVSLGLISPLESSPGAQGQRNVSGLEGQGIPLMGRDQGSGTPAGLQDPLRWFCSTRCSKAEGRILSPAFHILTAVLRARMGHGVGRIATRALSRARRFQASRTSLELGTQQWQ